MCLTITSNAWNKKLLKKIPLWINLISSKLILSDAIAYNSTQCIKEIFTVNILAKSVWYPLDFQFPFITENYFFWKPGRLLGFRLFGPLRYGPQGPNRRSAPRGPNRRTSDMGPSRRRAEPWRRLGPLGPNHRLAEPLTSDNVQDKKCFMTM